MIQIQKYFILGRIPFTFFFFIVCNSKFSVFVYHLAVSEPKTLALHIPVSATHARDSSVVGFISW